MQGGHCRRRCVGSVRAIVGTRIDGGNWDRGANPKGMLYYGPHGEMSVQVVPDVERKQAGAVMTPDEAFIAVEGLHRLCRHIHGRRERRHRDAPSAGRSSAGRFRAARATMRIRRRSADASAADSTLEVMWERIK